MHQSLEIHNLDRVHTDHLGKAQVEILQVDKAPVLEAPG